MHRQNPHASVARSELMRTGSIASLELLPLRTACTVPQLAGDSQLKWDWDWGEQPSCAQVLRGCVRDPESVCRSMCCILRRACTGACALASRGALGAYGADSEESDPKSLQRRSVPAPGTATQPSIR